MPPVTKGIVSGFHSVVSTFVVRILQLHGCYFVQTWRFNQKRVNLNLTLNEPQSRLSRLTELHMSRII